MSTELWIHEHNIYLVSSLDSLISILNWRWWNRNHFTHLPYQFEQTCFSSSIISISIYGKIQGFSLNFHLKSISISYWLSSKWYLKSINLSLSSASSLIHATIISCLVQSNNLNGLLASSLISLLYSSYSKYECYLINWS